MERGAANSRTRSIMRRMNREKGWRGGGKESGLEPTRSGHKMEIVSL